jgi:hypothetical protein
VREFLEENWPELLVGLGLAMSSLSTALSLL